MPEKIMNQYQKWVESLFDREEKNGDWRWDFENAPPELQDHDAVEFFIRLMQDLPKLLKTYNRWQISLGLEYLFNGSMSNFMYSIREGNVPLERRIEAIQSIKTIYEKVFEPMCVQMLGHLSENGNELNSFCYMLWDATPLSFCEGDPNPKALYGALADVMEAAIQSDNIACIESGLHGLGHMVSYHPECSEIIHAFIVNGRCTDKRVLRYAKSAETGCVQ